MRWVALLVLAPALAARADEDSVAFRPLLGVSVSASDSGLGLGAQAGARFSSVLLRATLDFGGNGSRGYTSLSLRGDWLHPISDATALVAGIGIAGLGYGFIFDDPVGEVTVLTPEVGVLFGHRRWIGRFFAGLTVFVPLGPVEHPRDRQGQAVIPPHAMVTVLLSL